jgi:Tol biopolymer transport system component
MAGNGIRPQAASAKSGPLAKRLVCPDCGDAEANLSQDGRTMVFTDWNSGDLVARDLSTGKVRRLMAKAGGEASGAYAEAPVLSPDRRQIVYEWYTGEKDQFRVMPNEPGGKARILVDNREFDNYATAAWFPDGKSVLVNISKPDKTDVLARVSMADGAIRVLKRLDWRARMAGTPASISPDGQYIAYSARTVNPSKVPPAPSDPSDVHIYILAADGSSETEIVKTAGINQNQEWADGRHILFTSDRLGKTGLWSVAVKDGKADGPETLVSADVGDVRAFGMAGGSFYYQQRHAGEYVHIVSPGGGAPEQSYIGVRPMWAPDGKSLAFKRHHPGNETYDLLVHSLETGEERAYLTNLGATGEGAETWFHDGASILEGLKRGDGSRASYRVDLKTGDFKELPGFGPNALAPDDKTLYVVPDVQDREKRNRVVAEDLVTGRERLVATVATANAGLRIALSPDGRTLALGWVERPGPKLHIARVSVDGSDFREVFTRADHLNGPGTVAWDRDGRSILFDQEQPGDAGRWGVMRVPAEGGPATLILAVPRRMQHFDLSPDGSRIVYSTNESASELWALDNVLPALK